MSEYDVDQLRKEISELLPKGAEPPTTIQIAANRLLGVLEENTKEVRLLHSQLYDLSQDLPVHLPIWMVKKLIDTLEEIEYACQKGTKINEHTLEVQLDDSVEPTAKNQIEMLEKIIGKE